MYFQKLADHHGSVWILNLNFYFFVQISQMLHVFVKITNVMKRAEFN